MRKLLILATLLAAPATAQNLIPFQGKTPPPLYRQGPTIVAEPVALTLAGFDADQDGLVTRAEAIAGAARSFASIAKGARDFGYIGYSDWAQRWLGDANALPNPFEVDADHDNRITEAEIAAALLAAFARFDANKDGTLSRTELITIRATAFGNDGPGGPRGKGRKGGPPPR